MERSFKLFQSCIPVKGSQRSLICDTQRLKYDFIPNGLYDILEQFEGETIEFVKNYYNHEFDEIIDDYFEFLLEKEYIFFTSQPDSFPKVSSTFNMPGIISNAILDFGNYLNEIMLTRIVEQLISLGCKHLQIRFFEQEIDEKTLSSLLKVFENINIWSIELIIKGNKKIDRTVINTLANTFLRLTRIVVHSHINDDTYAILRGKKQKVVISFTEAKITSHMHCGIILPSYFCLHPYSIIESFKFNSCLNKKISIDGNGNIKNCPSMEKSYGSINDTTLKEVLQHPDFKKYWNIAKDQIEVCKDCEFRHICTDCRAYREDPDNIYSKPLKCGYNPYTCEWENWSTNPLKQKAIEYYGMQELVTENQS